MDGPRAGLIDAAAPALGLRQRGPGGRFQNAGMDTRVDASRAPGHRPAETPTQRLDRLVHSSFSPWTGGLSPVSLALAWADWAWHLGVSPGRQMDLAALGAQALADTWRSADVHAELRTRISLDACEHGVRVSIRVVAVHGRRLHWGVTGS